jgi:hypothetical protein
MILNPWKEIKRLREKVETYNSVARENYYTFANLEGALREIAAQEKPTSNATVKRMARIAREALNE